MLEDILLKTETLKQLREPKKELKFLRWATVHYADANPFVYVNLDAGDYYIVVRTEGPRGKGYLFSTGSDGKDETLAVVSTAQTLGFRFEPKERVQLRFVNQNIGRLWILI